MSVNQNIKPLTLKRNSKGNLEVGGCDLVDLANEYKTPLYVVDEKTLRRILSEYREAFSSYENLQLLYACKACLNLSIAKICTQEGFGFDVVSGGELYTVYKSGADMSKIVFNGSNKSIDELKLALDLKVGRISVDNFYELEILNELAGDRKVEILLRITPNIECHTHDYIKTGQSDSKFGFDMSQIEKVVSLILNKYKNLVLKGLHAHIGSQIFELEVYKDEVDILTDEILKIKEKFSIELEELNIGGGAGVKYVESDEPISIFELSKVVLEELKKSVKAKGLKFPKLYLEPGRSIISTSGITLYRLGSSKELVSGKKYVAIDGGMADNPRPSLYGAQYTAEIANKIDGKTFRKVTIVGRFCESGDVLIKDITLPEIKAGDILCVYNTGAYNYSMASNYNRVQKPAMVLVNNSQSAIIVKRENLDDIIAVDVVPERLEK